jgi:hypothetical protein
MQQNSTNQTGQVHAALTRAKKPEMPHSQVLTAAGVLRAGYRIPAASGRRQRAAGPGRPSLEATQQGRESRIKWTGGEGGKGAGLSSPSLLAWPSQVVNPPTRVLQIPGPSPQRARPVGDQIPYLPPLAVSAVCRLPPAACCPLSIVYCP